MRMRGGDSRRGVVGSRIQQRASVHSISHLIRAESTYIAAMAQLSSTTIWILTTAGWSGCVITHAMAAAVGGKLEGTSLWTCAARSYDRQIEQSA